MNSGYTSGRRRQTRMVTLRGFISPAQFLIGVILAFTAGAILLWIFQEDWFVVYSTLLTGAFGTQRSIAETLLASTPLIFGGLAVAVGFRCGLFNMGVEGQILLGALVATYFGYAISLPAFLHLPLCLLAGTAMGGLWGSIPGYLKARYKIHEVITTIMLNYIAAAIATYMVTVGGPMKQSGQLPTTPPILDTAKLAQIMPPTRLSAGILLALVMAALVYVFLFRTRMGYKLRTVGFSPDAAEYVGISRQRYTVLAMALSGALGGLAGAVEILGLHYSFYADFSPGYGWDAIAVALLGMLHPVGVVAAAFLLGALHSGSTALQAVANVSRDVVTILSALIIFFMAMNQSLRPVFERRIARLEARTEKPIEGAATAPAE